MIEVLPRSRLKVRIEDGRGVQCDAAPTVRNTVERVLDRPFHGRTQ